MATVTIDGMSVKQREKTVTAEPETQLVERHPYPFKGRNLSYWESAFKKRFRFVLKRVFGIELVGLDPSPKGEVRFSGRSTRLAVCVTVRVTLGSDAYEVEARFEPTAPKPGFDPNHYLPYVQTALTVFAVQMSSWEMTESRKN